MELRKPRTSESGATPLYDAMVREWGSDPLSSARRGSSGATSSPECPCEWSGHRLYRL